MVDSSHVGRKALEAQLGASLLEAYSRSIFGKVSKPELDLLAFSTLIKIRYTERSDLWRPSGLFNWLRLDVSEIAHLSHELSLTPTRICSLIQQAALLDRATQLDPIQAIEELKFLLDRFPQRPSDLQQGLLRVFVSNRLTRQSIEIFLSSHGSIPDTSFHRDHLTI